MKKLFSIIILSAQMFLMSCVNSEYLQYQPANPPYGIELLKYGDDLLLLFRSENRSNTRFGGFLIFIDADPDMLKHEADFVHMSGAEKSDFLADADYVLTGSIYNTGRDKQASVLFSDNADYAAGSTLEIGGNAYTIISMLDKSGITAGSWMALRTYLEENNEIMSVSPPGNLVLIEP